MASKAGTDEAARDERAVPAANAISVMSALTARGAIGIAPADESTEHNGKLGGLFRMACGFLDRALGDPAPEAGSRALLLNVLSDAIDRIPSRLGGRVGMRVDGNPAAVCRAIASRVAPGRPGHAGKRVTRNLDDVQITFRARWKTRNQKTSTVFSAHTRSGCIRPWSTCPVCLSEEGGSLPI